MITSLLIANRGEIACRIIRTARALGIRTVAVYSDADAKALHVRQADEAVHIGPSAARESYLVGDRIIAAARATGAEAIHPGYGFLSENADFAQAVIGAGLIWVGPKPDSIRAMGLKDAAKQRMIEAGVPVTPGYQGADQSPERLRAEADAIGYPVLIKAVAGGGGKGMRRVNAAEDFADMLLSCQREAASSFGDDRVLIEKYVERPRHIEVQVFGDTHGNIVHLFERDCSLQRRHQKVIEEAPAPGMDEATRAAICEAAVKAARAVDYVGAGTIEFIADASDGLRADRIWFMEMNTRLQVEHPVTEEITGQDLVEWQLRVASGEPLPRRQDELAINGWAMEARLYAEDPASGFLPSTGRLDILAFARDADHGDAAPSRYLVPPRERIGGRDQTDWLRIDTGVEQGDAVSPFYDPMIAKIIVWQKDRHLAVRHLDAALARTKVWPVKTNAGFLGRLLRLDLVREGEVSTGLIPDRPELARKSEMSAHLALGAAKLLWHVHMRSSKGGLFIDNRMEGFRLNAAPCRRSTIFVDNVPRTVAWDDDMESIPSGFKKVDGQWLMFETGEAYAIDVAPQTGTSVHSADGSLISPMPGRTIAVDARQGDAVAKGQKLVTLEAMKMEHSLVAPFDGIVTELHASEGGQVSEGMLLVKVEKAD